MLKTRITLGKSFGELLIEKGLITKEKLQEMLRRVILEKKKIEQLLEEAGYSEDVLAAIKAEYLGYEFVNLEKIQLPSVDVWKHMKPAYAKKYKVLPLYHENDVLTLAMVEPRDFIALEEVMKLYRESGFKLQNIKVVMATSKQLFEAIARFYAISKEEVGMSSIMSQVVESMSPDMAIIDVKAGDASEDSAPIVMLANKIIEEAFVKRASDVHLEPAIDHLRVRYRIDGELAEVMRVPKYAQDSLCARIKIMCDMRLDEKRQPQDGRIDFTKYNPAIEIDLRVSSIPTPSGEDLVMRILDKKSPILSLEALGLSDYNAQKYRDAINSPYGIILHVGPTGSGKTTALYAALKFLDTSNVKIVTAENPVEYQLGGQIIQSNINPSAGYTFAKAIRAFLRHDPDIILIGEVRDNETAKTAVEASLTGHLVFSTLHTNDAVGTVIRLTEMGIEPYLVADSLLLICAQRLVRKICSLCKESYTVTPEEVDLSKGDIKLAANLFRGKGCNACDGLGYRGRVGIYEILSATREFRNLLIKGATTDELRTVALRTGMRTLRQDAIEKALSGVTSLEEVLSATLPDEQVLTN